MELNNKKKSQNIYDNKHEENDMYTPQISKDVLNQRLKDFNRTKLNNIILGSLVLIISLILVFIIIKKYFDKPEKLIAITPATQGYIPKYTLDNQSKWVMDYDENIINSPLKNNDSISLNYYWIKRATYNLILGEKAYEVKDYKNALKYFQNANKIIPELEDLPLWMGMCYLQLKDYEYALDLLNNVDVNNLNKTILNNIGIALTDAKSYELALQYLNKAIIIDPLYSNPKKNIAFLYKEMGNSSKAVNFFEKYLDQIPDDYQTRFSLALYLTKISNNALAIEHLKILLDSIHDDPTIHILLYYNAKAINNLEMANDAMMKASNLTTINNPLKWMSDKEFDEFKSSDNFESIMINE